MKQKIKIGFMIIINIGLILFCYGLLWNDLHWLTANTYVAMLVKIIFFVVGLIVMNKKFKKSKFITGICLALVIIIAGSIIGTEVGYALPTSHSNSDWFDDGVN